MLLKLFPTSKHVKNQRKYEFFCLFLLSHSKQGGSTLLTIQFRPHKSYAKVTQVVILEHY